MGLGVTQPHHLKFAAGAEISTRNIHPVGADEVRTPGSSFTVLHVSQPTEAASADELGVEREVAVLTWDEQTKRVDKRRILLGRSRECDCVLDDPNISRKHAELRLSGDPRQLVEDEKLRGRVQQIVDQINKDVGSWESIKQFKLLPEDFSEEAGEMTPTLKVKRRAVQERHQDEIEAMYREGAEHRPAKGH